MFFIDKPYVSDFLKNTLHENNIPLVGTNFALSLNLSEGSNLLSETEAIQLAHESDSLRLYSNSENAIGWVADNLSFTNIPTTIELFKNKLSFRELTKPLFPKFYFRGVKLEQLKSIIFEELPLPFIIKPTVGFFSMGVYKVESHQGWLESLSAIEAEVEKVGGLYPNEVLDTSEFIIEEFVEGEEYAVDAYFNDKGEPVIVGILKHIFSSDSDVSDRVYFTSKDVVEPNLIGFTKFIADIGELTGVKNFPIHIELRKSEDGTLIPIEVNPMRFGGWCTTADLTYLAFGFNPYLYYYNQQKPDWPELLSGKDGLLYSVIVLDNSSGIDPERIHSFDYDALLSRFETPIELRRIDYRHYPVFGFLFTETHSGNMEELFDILNSDLIEFINKDKNIPEQKSYDSAKLSL